MQLKVVQGDQKKGKSSSKCRTAIDELQYLMDFNQSTSLALAKISVLRCKEIYRHKWGYIIFMYIYTYTNNKLDLITNQTT